MGIFDKILRKREETKKPEEKEKSPVPLKDEKAKRKPIKKTESGKPKKEVKIRKVAKEEKNIAYETLLEPLVSEKSTGLGQFNKYVFKVHPKANKFQIKSAVESYYGVGVTKVNIIRIHPKKRIHGRTIGWKQGFKKVVVTLQPGDAIGVTEGA